MSWQRCAPLDSVRLQSFGWSPYQTTECDTDKSSFFDCSNKDLTVCEVLQHYCTGEVFILSGLQKDKITSKISFYLVASKELR